MHGLFCWKSKKVLQSLIHFKFFLSKSDRKPNKMRVDQDSRFYNT